MITEQQMIWKLKSMLGSINYIQMTTIGLLQELGYIPSEEEVKKLK